MSAELGNWEQHIWCLPIGGMSRLKEQAFFRNPAGMTWNLASFHISKAKSSTHQTWQGSRT